MEQSRTHIAILPSPGMGHLIPHLEFAKHLVNLHQDFCITCIIPSIGPPPRSMQTLIQSLPPAITSIFLPPTSLEDLPAQLATDPSTQILIAISRSLPSIHDKLKSLNQITRISAFVIDPFGIESANIAKKYFNIPPYILFTSNAMCLSFFFHLPKLDEETKCEFRNLKEPVKIPGCIPIHGRDLLDPVQDRTSGIYKFILNNARQLNLANGIIINSFDDLEEGALKAMKEEERAEYNPHPPVYPIGPIIQKGSIINEADQDGFNCIEWLDKQPDKSVVFVSFGSGGTLSCDQITELAFGLEMSGENFLWVVRNPNNESSNAAYLTSKVNDQDQDPNLGFLPNGFLERINGKGLVVPSWAPQIQILAHKSTSGFISHCGWNSTLESVVHGVPLIAWPLFAEQKMNAVEVVEDLRVALRPTASENGVIGRQEIAKVVKDLTKGDEGKRVRQRMEDLKDAAEKAHGKDGSSTKALLELALKWKNTN